MCSLALTACNDDDSIIDRTGGNNLQVEVSANFHSRAPIHESTLPDNNPIGVTLTAKDGSSYDNQDYNNIPYSATTADGKQTWMPQDKPVTLSVTEGVAMAYWPYNADAADMTAVPVETDTQTDYMYSGNVTGLTNATPKAAFQMKHAMTLIRVNVVRGTYTAAGAVTAVTAASEAFCTSGTMNVSTGALADLKGAETPFLEEPADAAITTAGRVTEFLVLPDVTVDAAAVTLGVTVDGRKYNTAVEVSEAFKQGYIYTYNLTLDNTALNVSGVSVTPWDLQSSVDTELNAQDDQYIVKVSIESDDYEYIHNIEQFIGVIDWGDGTIEEYNTLSYLPLHRYEKKGDYIIVVNGKINRLNSNGKKTIEGVDKYPSKDISKIIHIGGEMGITSMYGAFAGQTKLTEIPVGIFDGLTEVTDFKDTFYNCKGLIGDIPVGLFDKCTRVKSFQQTFMNCSNITGAIPAGLFDKCTEVTNFGGTFAKCTGITSIPTGLFNNNTKVTSFGNNGNGYGCFGGCKNITEIPERLFDNCTEVTDFQYVFYQTEITSIPEGLFDKCTEVTDFRCAFANCTGITEIPTGLFDNNNKVTTFDGTFMGCSSLTAIPKGLFDNCTEVTNFGSVFRTCGGVTVIPEGLFDNNTKVTSFNSGFAGCPGITSIPTGLFDNNIAVMSFSDTFSNCVGLTEIPAGLFDKCTEVTNFSATFWKCNSLTSIPEGLFDKCTKVTSFASTFTYCSKLTGESPYTIINVDGEDRKVHLYERSLYPEHFTAPTSYGNCFATCDKLTDIAEIGAAGWN